MNFNFFINTQTPGSVAPGEQLASLGLVEGLGTESTAPLPVEQLQALTASADQSSSAVAEAGLAPMSLEALASLGGAVDVDIDAEPPLPVEQLEAMIGGGAESALGDEAAGLAPMPEEEFLALGANERIGGAATEAPMSVGELEAMIVGVGDEMMPDLAPLSVEELGLLDEAGPPPVPESIEGDQERPSPPKAPARARRTRGKPESGD